MDPRASTWLRPLVWPSSRSSRSTSAPTAYDPSWSLVSRLERGLEPATGAGVGEVEGHGTLSRGWDSPRPTPRVPRRPPPADRASIALGVPPAHRASPVREAALILEPMRTVRAALCAALVALVGCSDPSPEMEGDAADGLDGGRARPRDANVAPDADPPPDADIAPITADAWPPGDVGFDDAGSGDAGFEVPHDAAVPRDASDSPDAGDAAAPPPSHYRNPVLDQSGDPYCERFGNLYYLYLPQPHRVGGRLVGGNVLAFTSPDLVNWRPRGIVYDNVDERYGGQQSRGLWAPEVHAVGGRYYLFYVNVMSDPLDPRIGDKDIVVVESNDPLDFRGGHRTVLLDGDYAFIDPSFFFDRASGQSYLLYKSRGPYGGGTSIHIRPMRSPRAFSGGATELLHTGDVEESHRILEHPMMIRQGGTYFLLFSKGDGAGTTYQIAYATSRSATGPFVQRPELFASAIDRSDLSHSIISPGAASIVRDGAGEFWMVYRQKTTLTHTFADRAVCIDPITIDGAGARIRGTPTRDRRRLAPVAL